MRKEKDFIGEVDIPQQALYGVHAVRARENFPDKTPFQQSWYEAVGLVKAACYKTCRKFQQAVDQRYPDKELSIRKIPYSTLDAMEQSAYEVAEGKHFMHFIVPAVNGGAGTSINLNVDEIIANAALQKLGKHPGDYDSVHPIEDANIFQSTNDVIPTALRVAAMKHLITLEKCINDMRFRMEQLEADYRNTVRVAYTQMQEAVPSSYGKLFSAYSDTLSRDWWRISKCSERIKVVNLGGSAIGTGMTVPRFFIMEVVPELQRITGLPVTRGENLSDATQNMDAFVEVHGILKAHAVNLEKMAADLRLLSSDLVAHQEVQIPKKQVGSSIMPSKVNPVISEFVISAAHKIYSNDMLISNLSGQGVLDLNAYIPTIGHALLDSLQLLISMNDTLLKNMLDGLSVNKQMSVEKLNHSPSVTTALVPFVGYNTAAELAKLMRMEKMDIYAANRQLQVMEEEKLKEVLKPQNLLKLGFSIKEIVA